MDKKNNITFEIGNVVKLPAIIDDQYQYGIINEYDEATGKYSVWIPGLYSNRKYSPRKLEYLPPKIIIADDLKKFLRYEALCEDFISGAEPDWNLSFRDAYRVTLDDCQAMLTRLNEEKPTAKYLWDHWFCYILDWFYEDGYIDFPCHEDDKYDILGFLIPEALDDLIEPIFFAFSSAIAYSESDRTDLIDYSAILSDIKAFRQGGEIRPWLWSWGYKRNIIEKIDDHESILEKLDSETIKDCRNILEEFSARGDDKAIKIIGYSYYGGNKLYPCHWEKSRDCFLRLMDMEGVDEQKKAFYANTLGYIYYYGRCNGGVPQYEEALKYYTIGATGWVYESIYKLSDMYAHGYGTPVNKLAAKNLIDFIYDDNEKKFLEGNYDCKFADIALRRGNLCRDHIADGDPLYYYLIAECAIRKRLSYDYFGDANVFMGIEKAIGEIRKERPLEKRRTFIHNSPVSVEIAFEKHSCKVTFKKVKDGISITAKRLPGPGKEKARKFYQMALESGYCELVDSATETAVQVKDYWLKDDSETFIADKIEYKWQNRIDKYVFTHHGEEVAWIAADRYICKLKGKSKKASEEHTFAGVTFTPGGRRYDYIADDMDLSVGDKVIVFANGEEKEVEVIKVFRVAMGDMPLEIRRYKKILRKAASTSV